MQNFFSYKFSVCRSEFTTSKYTRMHHFEPIFHKFSRGDPPDSHLREGVIPSPFRRLAPQWSLPLLNLCAPAILIRAPEEKKVGHPCMAWHLGDKLGVYRWPQCNYKKRFCKSHSRLSKITSGNRCKGRWTLQNLMNLNLMTPDTCMLTMNSWKIEFFIGINDNKSRDLFPRCFDSRDQSDFENVFLQQFLNNTSALIIQ